MSEQVRRYKVWEADLVLPDDSEVVLASDYAALQAEFERMRELSDALESIIESQAVVISSLRAELAAIKAQEVRQEAVAWMLRLPDGRTTLEKAYPSWAEGDGDGYSIQPLYTTPQPGQDVRALVEALDLAANRLDRLWLDAGSMREQHTIAGWVEEARATLATYHQDT